MLNVHSQFSLSLFALGAGGTKLSRISYTNSDLIHSLTMCRLYTTEHRCSVCRRIPSIGWLYRCTQDRDLMMEAGHESGTLGKMDAISHLFEPRVRMRGPAARASKLSFLGEMTEEAFKTYNAAQILTIAQQRSDVSFLQIFIKPFQLTISRPWTSPERNPTQKPNHSTALKSSLKNRGYPNQERNANSNVAIPVAPLLLIAQPCH
jgi:hypothetical protein